MAQCATCVPRLYKSIIEEVISNVRNDFLDEGIDEQVLLDLKSAWEQRVESTHATDHSDSLTGTGSLAGQNAQSAQQMQQQVASGLSGQGGANNQPIPPQPTQTNLVPVQITVPAQQAGGSTKTITIHVPSTALANGVAGAQLQSILSAPAAAQTFSMDTNNAAKVIQRQLNTALIRRGISLPQQLIQIGGGLDSQMDGSGPSTSKSCNSCPAHKRKSSKKEKQISHDEENSNHEHIDASISVDRRILDNIVDARLAELMVDGPIDDSSDEMSGDDDDDDDEKEEEDEEKEKKFDDDEEEEDETGEKNEDPLNSNDDVSDDETGEAFETENVVVCQYDKVTRVRTKWRFNLKDGIMNLKGKDYVFLKATGEGEW